MKWILGTGIALAIITATITIIGVLLPAKHRYTESRDLNHANPERVWQVITDFQAYPSWRTGINKVQRKADFDDVDTWEEIDATGESITYKTIAIEHNKRLVRKIANDNLPFGGTWEFKIASQDNNTKITITEDGEVYNPIFRFISKYIIGHRKNVRLYLDDLSKEVNG